MVCLAIIWLRELDMPDKGKHQRWKICTTRFSIFLAKWLLIYVCLRIFADFPAVWAFHISHFCIYGTSWHIHHPFLIPYLKPEFSRLRICNSDAQKYKKKGKKNITNVAQQSDNTVVETWYGRRQESKAKTPLGSRLKIVFRLDFFENRGPIKIFF